VDDPGSVEKWEAAFDALSATLSTHPELRQPP
jgi:hypothetical protein